MVECWYWFILKAFIWFQLWKHGTRLCGTFVYIILSIVYEWCLVFYCSWIFIKKGEFYICNKYYLLTYKHWNTNKLENAIQDHRSSIRITQHIAESSQAKHTRLSWSEDSLERSTLDTAVFKILKQKIVQQQRITVDLIQHCAISSHRSRQHQNFLKKAYVQLLKHIDATRQY